jgi:uncharacterized membrane protein
MSDTPTPNPAPQPAPVVGAPLSDERQMAMIIYIAYLAAFAFPPLSIAGVVLAYVNRDTAPDWLRSHYSFQIYTFWLGLLYWVVSIALCVVLIGIPLLVATMAWYIVRCAMGLSRLMRHEAYPNPQSWTV